MDGVPYADRCFSRRKEKGEVCWCVGLYTDVYEKRILEWRDGPRKGMGVPWKGLEGSERSLWQESRHGRSVCGRICVF